MATKATKSKMPTGEEIARVTLRASANGAAIISEYGKPFGEQELMPLMDELSESITRVQSDDLGKCEAMLMAQAEALQSMFMNFSRRALSQEYQKNLESFFRMALKAQSQCRMTLETLAAIKNPPVVFAKQANIANGPQQVNNGIPAPAHAANIIDQSNELLELQHGQRLDTRATGATAGIDPAMATVGEIHRAENR